MNKKPRIHFIGIGGSGASAVAQLAHHQGYKVSGCDLQQSSPYLDKVKKLGIKTYVGQNINHLKNSDLLATSAAIFFQKQLHPEIKQAKKKGIAISWQGFLGKHLHKNKTVICIAGTHGKSTTTAIASLLFEDANLDPSVMIGATVPRWQSNARSGKSKFFIVESDEFYDNFLNYHPHTIILNNIEPDHPDYFKSQRQLYNSFAKHVHNLKRPKNLIFNQDSPGIKKLFSQLSPKFLSTLNLIGYRLKSKPKIKSPNSLTASNIKYTPSGSSFTVSYPPNQLQQTFKLPVPGDYNISNALGVIALGHLYHIPTNIIKKSLQNFTGIGRRLELLGTPQNIHIYDDYAHHPTAVRLTLKALRQKHPGQKIIAVVEPHSFSRTKQLLKWYTKALDDADQVIITPIFQARDTHNHGVSEQDLITKSQHKNIKYINSFDKITKLIKNKVQPQDIIVIMGAGKSYQLARSILEALKK